MYRFKSNSISILFAILSLTSVYAAQMPTRAVPAAPPVQEDFTWWYVSMFVLFVALIGAIAFWYKKKFGISSEAGEESEKYGSDGDPLDADAELAWLKSISKKKKRSGKSAKYPKGLPRTSRALQKNDISSIADGSGGILKKPKRNSSRYSSISCRSTVLKG